MNDEPFQPRSFAIPITAAAMERTDWHPLWSGVHEAKEGAHADADHADLPDDDAISPLAAGSAPRFSSSLTHQVGLLSDTLQELKICHPCRRSKAHAP